MSAAPAPLLPQQPQPEGTVFDWPEGLLRTGFMSRDVMINGAGLQLARFTFKPDGDPRAVAVLLHGYTVAARFELLRCAADDTHTRWEGSILQQLVAAGVSCYVMDQQAHGESEGVRAGKRAYFEAFDDLSHDALQLRDIAAAEAPQKPLYLICLSMGGAVAMRAAQLRSDPIADGVIFLAPMLQMHSAPAAAIALLRCLAKCAPTAPVLKPAPLLPDQLRALKLDPFNYTGNLPLHPLVEFVNTGNRFRAPGALEGVRFSRLLSIHALRDTSVNAAGSVAAYSRCGVEDASLVLIGGTGEHASAAELRTRTAAAGEQVWRPGGEEPKSASERKLYSLLSLDMLHQLSIEPGSEMVIEAAVDWLCKGL